MLRKERTIADRRRSATRPTRRGMRSKSLPFGRRLGSTTRGASGDNQLRAIAHAATAVQNKRRDGAKPACLFATVGYLVPWGTRTPGTFSLYMADVQQAGTIAHRRCYTRRYRFEISGLCVLAFQEHGLSREIVREIVPSSRCHPDVRCVTPHRSYRFAFKSPIQRFSASQGAYSLEIRAGSWPREAILSV